VQLHDIECLLAGGQPCEKFRCGRFWRVQDESAVGGDREQSSAGAAASVFMENRGGAGGVERGVDLGNLEE
jgi:hypothetical protein